MELLFEGFSSINDNHPPLFINLFDSFNIEVILLEFLIAKEITAPSIEESFNFKFASSNICKALTPIRVDAAAMATHCTPVVVGIESLLGAGCGTQRL